MIPQRKFGLEIYGGRAQEIAARTSPFDSYDELLILESEEHLHSVLVLLDRLKEPYERCELLWLGTDTWDRGELFADYAFVTDRGNVYVDLKTVAMFSLHAAKPDAEPAPAWLQLQEHLIGSVTSVGIPLLLIDRQLTELADKIARVYGCSAEWHD
ncbi:hypothetical protein [Cohnella terricola]|uniref:Uncharacterized protein n=1 Tax=Cohnella terricola TaxID=1289167 RepID=A0A559JL10_9BACL|nr:hypothetical protein [Cohnella terricola]TVY00562.1 hypothetical protein FPZ45_11115 [Cohnella terricola]